ncbi:activator of basal transcription 1-like [Chelonus insularis]|uniref:activator of basal transcription 1-like n=1 Tax=Chelonus insularis TaxID=460826 RepID=UPI00158B9BAF|nr:activator of basal transcription 1-like [Chelonus insularis]
MESDDETNKMECENQSEESDNSDYKPLGNLLNTENDVKKKKKKRGIIYLSKIPKDMNVTMIRETFSKFGDVGRVYLQLAADKKNLKKKKPGRDFTEGWVEFESKRVAKYVAATLNNSQVSTRKRSKNYDAIWNIKYLPRFKWVHLSERLAYEKAVHKQRLKTEIAQAKREINFYSYNIDRSKKLEKKQKEGQSSTFIMPEVKQRDTDKEIRMKKMKNKDKNGVHETDDSSENRKEFLKSIFS